MASEDDTGRDASTDPHVAHRVTVRDSDPPDLVEALQELGNVCVEAEEMGGALPTPGTIRRAETVLRKLYGVSPRLYFAHLVADGDIAVDAPGKEGQSAVFCCSPDGSVDCSVNLQGDFSSKKYNPGDEFPDFFVRDALAKMEDAKWQSGNLAEPMPFHVPVSDNDPLASALEDLNSLAACAKEAGEPIPSNALMEVAERQLRRIHSFVPAEYVVDSTSEGEIMISAYPTREQSVLLALFPDGGAFCSVLVPNAEFKESCATVEDVTDEALQKVADLVERTRVDD